MNGNLFKQSFLQQCHCYGDLQNIYHKFVTNKLFDVKFATKNKYFLETFRYYKFLKKYFTFLLNVLKI